MNAHGVIEVNAVGVSRDGGDLWDFLAMPSQSGLLAQVGRRIRRLRETHRWSLAELGRRSGFTASHISDIERGQKNLSLLALAAITEALGVRRLDVALKGIADRDEAAGRASGRPQLPAAVEQLAQRIAALPPRRRTAVLRAVRGILDAAE